MNVTELVASFKNGNIISIELGESGFKKKGNLLAVDDKFGTAYTINMDNINYMAVREHELQQSEMEKEKEEDTEA